MSKKEKETQAAAKAERERRLAENTVSAESLIADDTGAVPEHFFRDESVLTEEQERVLFARETAEREAAERHRRRIRFFRILIVLCGALGLSLPALLLYANKDRMGFQWQYFPALLATPEVSATTSPAAVAAACRAAGAEFAPDSLDPSVLPALAAFEAPLAAGAAPPPPPATAPLQIGRAHV